MCGVLQVSRAGYYRWKQRQREPAKREQRHCHLRTFLLKEAVKQYGILGYRKLWIEAVSHGYACGKNQVQRLLQSLGYRSCVASKPGYQKAKPGVPAMPNLLKRQFNVACKNQVWVSDITQFRCKEGWHYLAVIIDLANRKVVGKAQGPMNSAELVVKALKQAWKKVKPDGSKLMFHSDQGSQYHSAAVMRWLSKRQVTISMSRRGNCWDNACAESFFALLKKEWTHRLGLITRKEMAEEVDFYVTHYYHKVRRHTALGGVTPNAFEQQLNAA